MDNPNPKRRIALMAVAVALLAIVTVVVLARRGGNTELVLYGNVDIREVTVGFRVPGRIATLSVDEGDAVHTGQELAALDPTPLQLELAEARASAAAIEKRLSLLKSGFRPEEIAQSRAVVAERRAAVVNAEAALARQEQLKNTGAVAARVYDDALAARDQARARLTAADENFSELSRGYRKQEIDEADANLARANATVAQVAQRISDARLLAPADGVILTRAVEPGAILAAGTAVFTVSLQSPVWARVYIGEPDLGRAAPGRAVLLYTDARPGKPYRGRIGFVSPTAEFTPKNVETSDLRTALVYRGRVVVSDPDDALRQGMPVTVRIDPAGSPAAPR